MDERECELEQYIQERAERDPGFPRLVEEARRKRDLARLSEVPGYEQVRKLSLRLWSPVVADDWMFSPNGYLGGDTPAVVLELSGPEPVVAALEAAFGGAHA